MSVFESKYDDRKSWFKCIRTKTQGGVGLGMEETNMQSRLECKRKHGGCWGMNLNYNTVVLDKDSQTKGHSEVRIDRI